MSRFLANIFILVLIVFQSSCKTLQLEGEIQSVDSLEVILPTNDFDLELIDGYKQIKPQNYYYEYSRWLNKTKNIDFYVSYYYLLGNYVFSKETGIKELIKEYFEDRVLSMGDETLVTKVINKKPLKKEVTAIVPFKLEDANCHYFLRYLKFDVDSYGGISSGGTIFDILGDAKLNGYVCNYGANISNESLVNFLRDIEAGAVYINTHIDELKKKHDDTNS